MNGRWAQTGAVLERRLGRDVLLLPRHGDAPFLLTGAGVDLWDRLAEPRNFDHVVAEMARQYAMPEQTVAGALIPVMQELVGRGAIVATTGDQHVEP